MTPLPSCSRGDLVHLCLPSLLYYASAENVITMLMIMMPGPDDTLLDAIVPFVHLNFPPKIVM